MAKYNHTRTAYKARWDGSWYLVPDGKKRAPLFGDGPLLPEARRCSLTEEHFNLITNKDRILLLEAIAGGCFDLMWDEMRHNLRYRSKNNFLILKDYAEGLGIVKE